MELIDRQYVPFYSSRKMVVHLACKGCKVNRKRVQRLMKLMDIHFIYPKRDLSRKGKEHKIYPYLLKGGKYQNNALNIRKVIKE